MEFNYSGILAADVCSSVVYVFGEKAVWFEKRSKKKVGGRPGELWNSIILRGGEEEGKLLYQIQTRCATLLGCSGRKDRRGEEAQYRSK